MHMRLGGAIISLLLAALGPEAARACMIDLTPSIRANGAPAVLNTVVPSKVTADTWAPFRFRSPFAVGRLIRFSEDTQALARVLPPEVVHGRWIWTLGDGARAIGYSPVHRYLRPGTYIVSVAVRIPRSTETFTFDAAQVQIGH